MAKKHLDIQVSGKVQGVGFRYTIMRRAEKMSLRGYARNLRDKSVCIEIEGEEEKLNEFIDWLKSSPGLCQVAQVHITEDKIKGFREFLIY